ncbi:receptor-like serine/threonine-protein kinase ale2 [Phtheirospermum japonicum]|uniref:non-specific serine/threonine protein kinase n=1 Tax=Phtheirospermum japonicum TaxID=374723 RepID=A0A830BIZ4_9LAMI|nr:receptor-like serine/threonine-protein kinase ale2 [Phtheirospermum japonicum]
MLYFIILSLLALLVSTPLASASFNPLIAVHRRHFKYSSTALSLQSSTFQGPIYSPTPSTLSRHHHHAHRIESHAASQSPSVTPGCSQTCPEPLTLAPFGAPCSCVLPVRVRLLLGVPVFSIFPEVTELEIEVAAGTYLRQSQVAITGVVADDQNSEKAVVDIDLVPLGGTFDNTTVVLTYYRFLRKKVLLNRALFGDYDVLYIKYPGFPDLPSSGVLSGARPTRSAGSDQYLIAAGFIGKKEKMNRRIIFVISLSAFVFLVVCSAAVVVVLHYKKVHLPFDAVSPRGFTPPMNTRFGKKSMQSSSRTTSTSMSVVFALPGSFLSVKTFALVELEKATDKFSPEKILGEGGFGCVYHGVMENGTEVAVKLLKRDDQNGDHEFIAEIEILSRLHHRNLVKLIGADRSKRPLDWDVRLKIALGAARGLAYLHEESNPRVIHRDFKASNVLLEDDFTPKVSDFGLAREATEGSQHISTRVMGTFGYGVVLLELLTGRKPVDMSQNPGQENLVVWAQPLLTNREGLEQLVDPALAGTYNFDDMAKVAAIASTCVHPEVTQRPFMGEVVQALKLINNDTAETCGDVYSPEQPSARYSDTNGDFVLSEGSWWDAECVTPRLMTELGKGSVSVGGGRVGLPTRHENRSGPLRVIRSDRDYYRFRRSMSERKRIEIGCKIVVL